MDDEDGLVSIIRVERSTELDLQEVLLHPLHSCKNLRGRLVTSTEVISGSSVEEMKKFVPENLTSRIMIYKASVFNLPGKFTPVEIGIKNDDAVPDKLKGEQVQNYWMLEKLIRTLYNVWRFITSFISRKLEAMKDESKFQYT